MSDEDDEEFGKSLKEFFPEKDYPQDELAATRAEYTTHVRMMNKDKSGCPLFVLTLATTGLIGAGVIMGIISLLS